MKKAYALLLSIFVISIFSYSLVFIFETKALSAYNNQNNYLHLQAQLHLDFLDRYVKTLDLNKYCYKNIKLNEDNFLLEAIFTYNCNIKNTKASIDLFVTYRKNNHNISIHKNLSKTRK